LRLRSAGFLGRVATRIVNEAKGVKPRGLRRAEQAARTIECKGAMNTLTLKYVWGHGRIPVVLRRTGKRQRLRVRLPYAKTNRQWLQNDRRMSPTWIASKRYWELPKAWFSRQVVSEVQQSLYYSALP
jgi:hypothetical protein